MKKRYWLILGVVILALVLSNVHGCRRVTLVGDSLMACARDDIVNAINANNGESWVYTEHIKSGCTSYNNPINYAIYDEGIEAAFSFPDVVVFSIGSNDMGKVTHDKITFESAVQSFQTLINQAVVAGANCIVLLESSHRFRGESADPEKMVLHERFEMHMDDWYAYWHSVKGDNSYLGLPYKLLIADISEEIESDMDAYIWDYIHFNKDGAQLAANAVVEKINECPEGRWIFGANTMQPGAELPPNPYREGMESDKDKN